ncbi:RNA transcription, translation and transport factor protein [Anthonomus grandis grandis]|uniref:RNA transcription, translation and transport factor protein n=1 Tax=Anthonomus grandis grandis TaxID=2921223 RepID=UPI0021664C08|nr:RNA transcription, translation and transport factor protein [Anthonomus grandis grandis]
MSKRLLSALEYPGADKVDLSDEKTFRAVILWLETNKIKGASQHVLGGLKNQNSNDWNKYFDQYKDSMGCPVLGSSLEELHWLLGQAVQMHTSKNKNLYLKHAVDNIKSSSVPSVVAENPLDKLDFRSKEFTDRINQLAKALKIVPYPDPLVTLRAVRKVVCSRLTPECVEDPSKVIMEGTPFPYQDTNLGFEINDPILSQAAKILRMLYIHDLRDLQTKANELIVKVQGVTANPKTDTKLGKVGR